MGARIPKNEAAPAVGTASAGLQQVARFSVICAVAGRCLLLEANHCVTFEGSGVERIESKLRDSNASVKWFVFPARPRTLAVAHNNLQECARRPRRDIRWPGVPP